MEEMKRKKEKTIIDSIKYERYEGDQFWVVEGDK